MKKIIGQGVLYAFLLAFISCPIAYALESGEEAYKKALEKMNESASLSFSNPEESFALMEEGLAFLEKASEDGCSIASLSSGMIFENYPGTWGAETALKHYSNYLQRVEKLGKDERDQEMEQEIEKRIRLLRERIARLTSLNNDEAKNVE